MIITRDFKETVKERIRNDKKFAEALRDEAELLLSKGETETALLYAFQSYLGKFYDSRSRLRL